MTPEKLEQANQIQVSLLRLEDNRKTLTSIMKAIPHNPNCYLTLTLIDCQEEILASDYFKDCFEEALQLLSQRITQNIEKLELEFKEL